MLNPIEDRPNSRAILIVPGSVLRASGCRLLLQPLARRPVRSRRPSGGSMNSRMADAEFDVAGAGSRKVAEAGCWIRQYHDLRAHRRARWKKREAIEILMREVCRNGLRRCWMHSQP